MGGVLRAILGVVAIVGLAAGAIWFAFVSQKNREVDIEARRVVPLLADAVARCAANSGLPESAPPVPKALADVSGKRYTSGAEDWAAHAYSCERFFPPHDQLLQYVWQKTGDKDGHVMAIGDLDADGKADTWYEVVVACRGRTCEARNFTMEVEANGTRNPPLLLRLSGRDRSFLGEPPPKDPLPEVSATAPTSSAVPTGAAPRIVRLDGGPAELDLLLSQAEAEAVKASQGVVLTQVDVKGLVGDLADPAKGSAVEILFGRPLASGVIPPGDLIGVTYGKAGFSVKLGRSQHERRAVFAECLASKALASIKDHSGGALALYWDGQLDRGVWRFQKGNAITLMNSKNCAHVKQ